MFSQQPEQKNLLIAIVLSLGVLLAWQYFYAGPKFKEEQDRLKLQQHQQQQVTKHAPSSVPQTGAKSGTPTAPGTVSKSPAAPVVTRDAALAASPRVGIETGSLRGSISLKGGRIDDLKLVKYHETVDKKSPLVTLFSPSGAPHPYYAEQGWVAGAGSKAKLPDSSTLWTAETKGPLTPTSPVVLRWDNGEGLIFRRTIKVDEDYMFSINDEVENTTANAVTLFPYALISRHGMPQTHGIYILHEGLIGVAGDSGLIEISYSELAKEAKKNEEKNPAEAKAVRDYKSKQAGWFGITDKYWAAVIVPQQKMTYDARMWAWRDGGQDHFQVDYRQPGVTIQPGARGSAETQIFAGAKDVGIVDGYKAQYDIKQFDSLIDWGTFWYITKPLFHLLDWINGVVGNFGVSILIVTVLVKALFFPLANKSYDSMAKMKKLQPEMERIRDRFKDDKARQQQELMALYSKEKVNPLAGCLPILVQIPVFFALDKVLFVS
ncbi:MAG: membrane protein insertase YidC, partial [Hyphomicrobiaceae bacterium]